MTNSNYQSLETQQTPHKMEIPNNKLAKLMYYLECVFTVIEKDTEIIYTNCYFNYNLISKKEELTILNLVYTFNSKVMKELNLFVIEPDLVPVDKENEFYDISDEKFKEKINSEVEIGEKSRKVLKVMACKETWFDKYYIEPIKEYQKESEAEIKKQFMIGLIEVFGNRVFKKKKEKE